MELILRPWKLYVDPSGRSRRSEYWTFFLLKYGILILLAGIGGGVAAALRSDELSAVPLILVVVWVLATFIPSCMLLVRRCHDFDTTGKLALLTFVPYIGFIVVIVIGCIPGTVGENERGFDPREPDGATTASVFE